MAELAAGSHRALEDLYRRYSARLTGFFWRLGSQGEEIDELVQEVFVKLWRHRGAWRGRGRLSTYLFGIAKSAWLDALERRRRAGRAETAAGPRSPSRPEAELERRELGEEISRAIAALPEQLRIVFSLATAGELKYREISEMLEVPVGTVKSRMAAAEDKLRQSLSAYLGMRPEP
jgi:RNA polymerase sigma-70 factor (ECF subfamily)